MLGVLSEVLPGSMRTTPAMGRRMKSPLCVIFICGTWLSPPAVAERFVDVYLGTALPRDTNVTAGRVITADQIGWGALFGRSASTAATRRADFDTALNYGVRGGSWFDRKPRLGWAVDLSHWDADAQDLEMSIFALSVSLMYRWQGEEDVGRRLEPYVGFGVGLFDTDFKADLQPEIAEPIKVHSQDFGYSLHAGVSWPLKRAVTVLFEYRIAQASGSIEARSQYGSIGSLPPFTDLLRTSVSGQQLLAGFSFRF